MEVRFGHDFSRVRIHDDSAASASARALGANAYTLGQHVLFADGQYAPHEPAGLRILAHELAHVVQQRQNPAAGNADGLRVSDPQDPREVAAEQIARTVTTPGQSTAPVVPAGAPGQGGSGHLIQRQKAAGLPAAAQPAADVEDIYGPPNRGAGVVTIEQFIRDVETVEAANPGRSGSEILTLIRKLYYGDMRFDRLIPGAPEVPAVESCFDDEDRPCSEPVGVCVCHYSSDVADPAQRDKLLRAIRRLRQHADENASGDNPSPYVLVGDDLIDIGHVLLGMDALLHPESDQPFSRYGLTAVTGGAGWEADVGIAMVTLQEQEANKQKSPDVVGDPSPTLEDYYQNSAPATDVLGDVDPFGISSPRFSSLSSVLRAYYLGDSRTGPGYQNRWHVFAEMNSLRYTVQAGKVIWKRDARELVIQRIKAFADLYALRASPITARFGSVRHNDWPKAGAFADRFLKDVAAGLEKELAARPAGKP